MCAGTAGCISPAAAAAGRSAGRPRNEERSAVLFIAGAPLYAGACRLQHAAAALLTPLRSAHQIFAVTMTTGSVMSIFPGLRWCFPKKMYH